MGKGLGSKGPHFAQLPHDLIDDPDLRQREIAVYAVLMRHSDFASAQQRHHLGADPGAHTIARKAGMSRRTFHKARATLEEKGWLSYWQRAGQSPLYILHNSPLTEEEQEEAKARWQELRSDVENS